MRNRVLAITALVLAFSCKPAKAPPCTTEPDCKTACDAGDQGNCVLLANISFNGTDAAAYPRAVAMYQHACDAGVADGCAMLAVATHIGKGVPADASKAFVLALKACDGGSPIGCDEAGADYVVGTGVAADPAKGAPLLKRACDANSAHGCANLGMLYWRGFGVPKDDAIAVQLTSKYCSKLVPGTTPSAGADGHACFVLGLATADPQEALGWLLVACEMKKGGACGEVGDRLSNGTGVPKDAPRGWQYYNSACNAGYKPGCDVAAKLYAGVVPKYAALGMSWRDFKSTDAGFSLPLPGEVQLANPTNARMAKADGKGWWFSISWNDQPQPTVTEADLEAERDFTLGNLKATFVSQTPCTLGHAFLGWTIPCVEVRAKVDGQPLRFRIYATTRKLKIAAFMDASVYDDAVIDAFFSSLTLL